MKAGRPERSFLLVGLRGVGKTVLLNRVRELADAAEYRSVLIEVREGKPLAALLLPALRQIMISLDRMAQISQKVKRGLRVLRSFFNGLKLKYQDIEIGVDVDPETGVADSGSLEVDLAEVFIGSAKALPIISPNSAPAGQPSATSACSACISRRTYGSATLKCGVSCGSLPGRAS